MTKFNPLKQFKNKREINCKEAIALLTSNKPIFWSWGANGFTNCWNKALKFRVRGHHHKGYIYLAVNGMDLYDVYLVSIQGNLKDTITDLYFDQLVEVIDDRIERIPDYKD